jgi:GWxTD domain-containing protein
VYISQKCYLHPAQGEYVESQLLFDAQSLKYHKTDTGKVASFQVIQIFKKDEDIVAFDKSRVQNVLKEDKVKRNFYFVEKFVLPSGDYDFEMIITDDFDSFDTLEFDKRLSVDPLNNSLGFSSITLVQYFEKTMPAKPSIFTKQGFDIIPLHHHMFPDYMEELTYYSELYNSDKLVDDSVYVLQESIYSESEDSSYFTRYTRFRKKSFYPILKVINIGDLPSGDYTLNLAVLDRNKTILSEEKVAFKRKKKPSLVLDHIDAVEVDSGFFNSIPLDSSAYYLASLIPIASRNDTKNIIQLLALNDNSKNMKYLQAFWATVNEKDPLSSWMNYKFQVNRVEYNFGSTFQVGHETDRGRIFLKYGYPTQIYEIPSSPSEYPYEIWQFDKIQSFTNRRFIFYNTTNVTNDYRLLHSNMIGEIQNRRWRLEINKRNAFDNDLDSNRGTNNREHWGQNSDLYYNSY